MAREVNSVALSLTTVQDVPSITMARSNSRATWAPESELSIDA